MTRNNPFTKGDIVHVYNRYYGLVVETIDRDAQNDNLLCKVLVLSGRNKIPVTYNRVETIHYSLLSSVQIDESLRGIARKADRYIMATILQEIF